MCSILTAELDQPDLTRARTLSEWWLEGSETSDEVLSADSCAHIFDLTTAPRYRRLVDELGTASENKRFSIKPCTSRKRRSAVSQRFSRRSATVASEGELSWEEAAQMMALEVLGFADVLPNACGEAPTRSSPRRSQRNRRMAHRPDAASR